MDVNPRWLRLASPSGTTPLSIRLIQKTVQLSYLQRNHCTASTKIRLVAQMLTIVIFLLVVVMKQRIEGLVASACVIINSFIDINYLLMRVPDSKSAALQVLRACARACSCVGEWGWILTKQKLNFVRLKKSQRSSLQPHFRSFPARKRTKKR